MLVALYFALWNAVYQKPPTGRLTLEQVLLYAAVGRVWWALIPADSTANYIARRVRDGTVRVDLVRPLNYVGLILAREVGRGATRLALVGAPMLVGILIVLRPSFAVPHVAAALAAFALAYLIAFHISSIVGLLSFTTVRISGFLELRDALFTLLGGAIVPLAFYPDTLRILAGALPFYYVYYGPLAVLVGDETVGAAQFAIGLGWLVVLVITAQWMFRRLGRELVTDGG